MPFDNKFHDLKNDPSFRVSPGVLLFILMISVSSFLKIYEVWNENFKKRKEIENENRITELNFLKAQLNPHFFFNSLNTIYSLSISKSPKTSDAILNLSELMRYMLSDKKDSGLEQKVKLTQEIDYITNYIELQKLRITPNNLIDFSIQGDISHVEVFPLLFISFIENAFKFGIHPVDKNLIKINFKVDKNVLEFTVVNSIHFQKSSYDSFGLGNQNSHRRINLYYPNNILRVDSDNNFYTVYLKINIDEN
jgi:LytS/YehU family sensor histidine kinase